MQKLIQYFQQQPKKIFLLDGLGAMLSTALLYFLLMPNTAWIGLSVTQINALVIGSLCLVGYDLIARIVYTPERGWLIRVLALLNTLYCITTLSVLILHYSSITILGWAYFLGEVAIVGVLVYLEWKISAIQQY